MGFRETIAKLLSGHKVKETKLVGKHARLEKGFRKINMFIARGMELNPAPKQPASRHPKKPKGIHGRWFFRCGDAGYRHGSKGGNVPIPFKRLETV